MCGGEGKGEGGVYSYCLVLSQQRLVLDIVSEMMTDWQTIDSVEIVQFSNFLNSLIWIYCIWQYFHVQLRGRIIMRLFLLVLHKHSVTLPDLQIRGGY